MCYMIHVVSFKLFFCINVLSPGGFQVDPGLRWSSVPWGPKCQVVPGSRGPWFQGAPDPSVPNVLIFMRSIC